jgi:hypothetical protein
MRGLRHREEVTAAGTRRRRHDLIGGLGRGRLGRHGDGSGCSDGCANGQDRDGRKDAGAMEDFGLRGRTDWRVVCVCVLWLSWLRL